MSHKKIKVNPKTERIEFVYNVNLDSHSTNFCHRSVGSRTVNNSDPTWMDMTGYRI